MYPKFILFHHSSHTPSPPHNIMLAHTIYYPLPASTLAPNQIVQIEGDEARHALQVKRVRLGDTVRLLDGAGTVADGRIVAEPTDALAPPVKKRERSLHVQIDTVSFVAPPALTLDVCSATPKGQHVDELIDGLCQVGAASWSPLHSARSVVDPRPTKLDRLDRVAIEAMKQCGRARRLRIDSSTDFSVALGTRVPAASNLPHVIIADTSGTPYIPSNAQHIRLLIGPEGGWTTAELAAARTTAAVQVASFGPHVMRIETAAVVASGIILAAEYARGTTT